MLALSKAEVVRHMATEASKITDHRAHISTSLSASGPQGAHTKDSYATERVAFLGTQNRE